MHVYQQDNEEESYLFLDWSEVLSVESDVDGVTIRLLSNHPLAQEQE